MRTQEEILQKIKTVKAADFFGVMANDLIPFLTYNKAKPYLKDEVTEKEWNDVRPKYNKSTLLKEMKDYLDFAYEKAHDERGLSAMRSMHHYHVWLWLFGEDEFADSLFEYTCYGIPQLDKIKAFIEKEEANG